MNRKHRRTLESIFKRPVQAGIKWIDVENLIIALGGEIEKGRSGSRVGIYLHGRVTVFHQPHPGKEMDKGAVKNMREFLELCEVRPC
jgi:hypothetical protein